MQEENQVYPLLVKIIEKYPGTRLGIAGILYSSYSDKYKCALVIAVPHQEMITLMNYSEIGFEKVICDARDKANKIVSDMTALFGNNGIQFFVPPLSQSDEKNLIAPFSFKYAAVNAGMGWIGKNGVLVTAEYGPRVRLSAVLVDYDLPVGKPVSKSMCKDDCFICVDTCPYNALKGMQWDIHKYRQDLIDYQVCNLKRSQYIKQHGRKNACGLCMVACPLGL